MYTGTWYLSILFTIPADSHHHNSIISGAIYTVLYARSTSLCELCTDIQFLSYIIVWHPRSYITSVISVIDGVNERMLRIMLLKNGKEVSSLSSLSWINV